MLVLSVGQVQRENICIYNSCYYSDVCCASRAAFSHSGSAVSVGMIEIAAIVNSGYPVPAVCCWLSPWARTGAQVNALF